MPDSDLTYETTDIVASPAAAAETVVALLGGVNTRWQNQQIKLSGWVNVTPDASATAVVLRVRRHAIGGALVGLAQTAGLGGGVVGAMVLAGESADQATADAPTVVAMDNAPHAVACAIAAPPAWMDNASNIILPGLYSIATNIAIQGVPTLPALSGAWTGLGTARQEFSVDAIGLLLPLVCLDVIALPASNMPFAVGVSIVAQNDATGTFSVTNTVSRLASIAGTGGEVSPADAVTDVVDAPGSLASGSYVLTAQMTGAAAPSTINGVRLEARVD